MTLPEDSETTANFSIDSKEATSTSGCRFSYRHYAPLAPSSSTLVVIGHGFMRNQNNFIDLGRALATQGVQVATLDFCSMRPWSGAHAQNALDMRQVATILNQQHDLIFVGFSAGALAALLAADNQTRAVITLDLVDDQKAGYEAARQLPIPIIGLHGPPSGCNAQNAGNLLFQSRPATIHGITRQTQLVPEASHCEFESPSNWLCEILCGDKDSESSDKATRQAIIDRVVSLVIAFSNSPRSPAVPL